METPPAGPKPQSRKRRLLRRAVVAALLLIAFPLVWAGLNRVTAPARAVTLARTGVKTSPPDPATPFCVAAYNIAHARGPAEGTHNWTGPRDARLDQIADEIAAWNADVVVLNEADFDATWSGRQNQAAWIAGRAGYPYRAEQRNYDVSLPFFRLRFGNAVLSRWPIVSARRVVLPAVAAWEALLVGRKDALLVTIDRGGEPVQILAVHLEVRDRQVRQDSVPRLAAFAGPGRPPVVVAGDFNCKIIEPGAAPTPRLDSSAGNRLIHEAGLTWAAAEGRVVGGGSFPSPQPNRLIDYILADPRLPMTRFEVIGSTLSDHRPVRATFGPATTPAQP